MTSSDPSTPANLRPGFSTLGCPDLDPVGLRALAARHQMHQVEIRCLSGTLDFAAALARHPGGAPAVRDFFLEAGVRVRLVGSSFLLTKSPPEQRSVLVGEAEAGEALGAKFLRVFGGGEWGEALTDQGAEVARAHCAWWQALRAARGWNIDLILETHDAFSGSPQVLALFEQTGGPMPLLWDAHHTWKYADEPLADTWKLLGDHVRHVHLKDSRSAPSDKHLFTYVAPGQGEFPLTEALGLLAEARFNGVVSLEWEKRWHPSLASLEEVLPLWQKLTAPFRSAVPADPPSALGTLVLRCDFDHASIVPATGPYFHGAREQYEDVVSSGPSSCPAGLGEPTPEYPRLGKLRIYHEGGNEAQRFARIVPDDEDPQNRVLRFSITEPNVVLRWPGGEVQRKSRVQAEVYGNIEWRDFYQTVRLRLRPEAAKLRDFPDKIEWFTLMEFWNNAGWTDEPYAFRFGLHLEKPDPAPGTDLYFATTSQTVDGRHGFVDVWHRINTALPVPFGQWIDLAVHFREGNAEKGRFYADATLQGGSRTILFDVQGCTHHPANPHPTGLKQSCPLKLYTSDRVVDYMKSQGSALEVDWDELSIWSGRVP